MQFFVQYSDCVFVYILHPETYSADLLATSPTLGSEMVDLTWCGETSVAIATEDGCIHVVDICCKTPISPVTSTNAEIDDFVHEDISKDIDIPSIISSLATEKAEPKLIDFDSAEGTTDTDVEDSQTDNEMDITLSNRFDTDPSLVSCFGDMMMSEDFKVYESQKLYLLNKHRIDMRVKELCSQRWIMLNKIDMAVSVLMETDLEQSQFKTDCLNRKQF
ncbi:hypothetical protein MAR_016365 [Mya arenaria]|uniref:Uncharacterized protein n=1 Tax=Mya arenaria TaxID=6604 RepID=A0ABY7FT54_MYAAR|nr:hypothetical protein MAR_016365 [Mya arenaria]